MRSVAVEGSSWAARGVVLLVLATACGGETDEAGSGGARAAAGSGGRDTASGGTASGGTTATGGGVTSGGSTGDDAGGASGGSTPATGGAGAGGTPDGAPPPPDGGCSSCGSWTYDVYNGCCLPDGSCGFIHIGTVPFLYKLAEKCQPFNQPGAVDTACEPVNIYFSQAHTLIASFPGCCRPDGRCGAVMYAESGCVAREDIDDRGATCTP